MADVKLNSLATKTNANAAAILVKDSATQNAGAEGWITKAQLNQIIRDEVKAQLSAITSGTPDVPVLDGSTMKYMTLANFAKVVGGLKYTGSISSGTLEDLYLTTQAKGITSNYYPSDIPSQEPGFIVNINLTSDAAFQVYLSRTHAYSRIRYYASGWLSWVTLG